MFFIGIFGIDRKNEEIRGLPETVCRECSGSGCILFRDYYRFHFFFIPLFTWGSRYRVVCSSCGTVYNVNEEKTSYSYRDLKNIQLRGTGRPSGYHDSEVLSCPCCGESVEESWSYCPSCGAKL